MKKENVKKRIKTENTKTKGKLKRKHEKEIKMETKLKGE